MARIIGYPDREPILDYTDIVEFFKSLDEALEALDARHAGVLEFHPGQNSVEYIVFDSADDNVRLFRVPWLEAMRVNVKAPLPHHITEYPKQHADAATSPTIQEPSPRVLPGRNRERSSARSARIPPSMVAQRKWQQPVRIALTEEAEANSLGETETAAGA